MKRKGLFLIYVLLLIVSLPYKVYAGEIVNEIEFELEKSTNIVKDSNQNLIRVGVKSDNPYLIKTDKNNNVLWEKEFDSNSYLEMKGLTIDDEDNIYISLLKKNNITQIDTISVNDYRFDAYIIKYNKNGDLLFETKVDANNEPIAIYQLYDLEYLDGYIYASGEEKVDIHFLKYEVENEGYQYIYAKYAVFQSIEKNVIIKIDKNGNPLWEKNYGDGRNVETVFLVEGRSSGSISFSTFSRKKYYVRQDNDKNIYVLAVKNNSTSPVYSNGEPIPGELLVKYTSNGEEIFSKEIESNIYSTDFIIDNDSILLVGKKYKEYTPPNPQLSYSEIKQLSPEERIAYDKKNEYNYNPYLYYLDLDGNFEKEILWKDYDRSLFQSIIKIKEDYIALMCSYNDSNNNNECFEVFLSPDKMNIKFQGRINYSSEGVSFSNNYSFEEGTLDENNNEYYLLVSENARYVTKSRVIIAKYLLNYGNIIINNDSLQGIVDIEEIENVKESTIKKFKIKPQQGYELMSLTIKSSDNSEIEYRKTEIENEYEFIMPSYDVTITPTFKKVTNMIQNPNTGNKAFYIVLLMVGMIVIGRLFIKKEKNILN